MLVAMEMIGTPYFTDGGVSQYFWQYSVSSTHIGMMMIIIIIIIRQETGPWDTFEGLCFTMDKTIHRTRYRRQVIFI